MCAFGTRLQPRQGGCVLTVSVSRHSKEGIFRDIYDCERTQWASVFGTWDQSGTVKGQTGDNRQCKARCQEEGMLGKEKSHHGRNLWRRTPEWTTGWSCPLTLTNAACWNRGGKARWAWLPVPMDGTLQWWEYQVQSLTSSSLGPGPLLEGWLSSESLPQGPKCHWFEQPPKEKLLGGGIDSPTGHHTPLHPLAHVWIH